MLWISRLYIFFVGIILTLTTGFGIAAFYPEPQFPYYAITRLPVAESCYKTPEATQSSECIKLLEQQEEENRKQQEEQQLFQNKSATHTRTTIFFGIAIGAIFTVAALGLIKSSKLVANGLILAGVLTAILTRFTVMLASFGADVTSTQGPSTLALAEFGILVAMSALVIFIGHKNLKEA